MKSSIPPERLSDLRAEAINLFKASLKQLADAADKRRLKLFVSRRKWTCSCEYRGNGMSGVAPVTPQEEEVLEEVADIDVFVLNESGYKEALLGLSLNKYQSVTNMPRVAEALSKAKAGSHRKILRQIAVWLWLDCPAYFFAELDTYKVGTTRNSSSTMHKPLAHITLIKGCTELTKAAFLDARERFHKGELSIQDYKANIPMGIMLQSVVSLNYEVLRTMLLDRQDHRLPVWQSFCKQVLEQVQYPNLLPKLGE